MHLSRFPRSLLLGTLLSLAALALGSAQLAPAQIAMDPSAKPGTEKHPVRVSAAVMARLLRDHPTPEYPPEARAKGISGDVVVAFIISDKGQVVRSEVISGPELLRDPASAALAHWTYEPYVLNGTPAYVLSTITMVFHRQPR